MAWLSNYTHICMWDVITRPCLYFHSGYTNVITYPCRNPDAGLADIGKWKMSQLPANFISSQWWHQQSKYWLCKIYKPVSSTDFMRRDNMNANILCYFNIIQHVNQIYTKHNSNTYFDGKTAFRWCHNNMPFISTLHLIIIVSFPKNYTWYVHYKHKNTSHTSHAHVTEEWLCNGWEGCQKNLRLSSWPPGK